MLGQEHAFLGFGRLPIESVGQLDIDVYECFRIWDNEFYKISNYLLGGIPVTQGASFFLDIGGTDELDVEMNHWTNVSKLEIDFRELECCLLYLEKLPTARELQLNSWIGTGYLEDGGVLNLYLQSL